MRLAQVLMMCLTITLATLSFTHVLNIWIVMTAMLFHGVLDSFWSPARLSMSPALVPREDLPAAIGTNATLFNLAQILGPSLAGVIIAGFDDEFIGCGVCFLIAIGGELLYLAGLFSIRKLRVDERVAKAKTGFFADFKEGLVYVFTKPGLGLYMGLMLMTTLIMRPVREHLAGFADGVFHQGPQGLALLTSALGAGALVGALVVANITRVNGLTRMILAIFFFAILVQFVFALAPTFHVAVGAMAFVGATIAVGGIGSQVLIQSSIKGTMRGRVVSLWSIIMRAGPPVGAWIIGGIAEFTGLQWAFAGVTTLYLVLFLAMSRRFKALARNMEAPPELP
jgi:MFS family permease